MANGGKLKRRGFVMTGGGAKGFYEAGVIHAFHITGMDFDVITGSSIGAMNAIFYAEYLYHKHQLPAETLSDPEKTVEAMDERVKTFHHVWWTMPQKQIIDDSEEGPLGQLKDDLLEFQLALPQLVRLGWWWTDPRRGTVPPLSTWTALLRVFMELSERLGGPGQVLRILKDHRDDPVQEAVRTYLARFGMEKSLVPAKDDHRLKEAFTELATPLRPEHLKGSGSVEEGKEEYRLVHPERTFKEYAEVGVDVRLTRANYRTGRLEVSTYLSDRDFMTYLERQAWRLQSRDPETLPLGSFRLQIPGDPNVVDAALASGRFPGVFSPFPVESIYDLERPENRLLALLLTQWLADPEAETLMEKAYRETHPGEAFDEEDWEKLFAGWRDSVNLHDFFPRDTDAYVDGGAIDNTPSNSAVDATREWSEKEGVPRRGMELDLYVVLLHPEPKVDPDEASDPYFNQVVQRTLDIQGAAKLSSDAVVVDTINVFGQRAEDLGESLLILLESYADVMDGMYEEEKTVLFERIRRRANEQGIRGYRGRSGEGILERMRSWGQEMLAEKLPLQVNTIKIHPERMALDTLQFTGRLGYKPENALDMLTMGCYNTLWALRTYLEDQAKVVDEADRRSLALAKKWMGFEDWPEDPAQVEELRTRWRCQRTACIFHAEHCPHGARQGS